MTEKEKTLLAGCLRGDKAAWDGFVQQYSNLVYHTIKKTFGLYHHDSSAEQVEDLFQEFFVALLRDDCKKLRQFRGERGCRLASWVRVVAARLTIDFLRKLPAPASEFPEAANFGDPDPSELLISEEQEKLFADAVQSLSARDRILIELSFREGLPPEEIAAILKTTVGAVYTQKSRILDKLREFLKTPHP